MFCLIQNPIGISVASAIVWCRQGLLVFFLACTATATKAHEFWIEPLQYEIESGETINASLKNGERFFGTHFSYLPQNFSLFTLHDQSATREVKSRIGDMPAVGEHPARDGLHVFAYVSTDKVIKYNSFQDFENFADKQDLGWITDAHKVRQLPLENITEVYRRFAKSLVASGTADGQDQQMGLTLELVALTNPYTRSVVGDQLPTVEFQLLYRQNPLPNTQIDVFYKSADKDVSITHYRTNADGVASIKAELDGAYLLNAVLAREPSPQQMLETGALWETLWASSTFGVSAQ
ncbi:MAG: DUF4198 domain-containing protein [Granulosicoccus sp.]|nr:DUF4198 domain-containing protein [Granulosicoccus sp.]